MPSEQQRDEGDTGAARRGPTPLVCEAFQGIQTKTTRAGVPDQQMFWCDGWMPVAPRKLRTLWGIGSKYTPSEGIVCFYFYNLGATPYAVVFLADGSAIQVNTTNYAVTQIMPPGTISSPSVTSLGVTQYASQYLIIVANQTNGYWVWDGTNLYGSGSLEPGVTLTNVGSGYTSPPVVTATGGNGSGASFVAAINNGSVTSVTMTNPGSGYQVGDQPTLTFTGGNQSGSGAVLAANMTFSGTGTGASATATIFQQGSSGGNSVFHVLKVTVNAGGSGYSSLTQAHVSGSVANNNPAVLSVTIVNGAITAITVKNGGDYFSLGTTVSITDTGFWFVSSVGIISGGSNYSSSPTITVTGGSAQTQAVMSPVVSGGSIIAVNVTNQGVYTTSTAPTLAVNDTAVTAAGTIALMPFGVQGTAVQTYAGHVWVANGNVIQFTAPGSVSDFATSDGGGAISSSDNFLRVKYTALIQSNGFLFLVGDSSMNYISGVQTNTPQGGNPTTTFTNNNSDPEIGTPYPATVTTFGADILVANSAGVFVSSGGTFVKKSDDLDGVYNTFPNFNNVELASAKATIFGQRVWMVLVPIIDPISGSGDNELFMFNGKFWWSSAQDVQLTYICGQEINSVFTAWGTDGSSLFPLFSQPSSAFPKVMATRLWDTPAGYDHTKSSVRLFALAEFLGSQNLSYSIRIDNENGLGNEAGPYIGLPPSFTWFNASGAVVPWFNNFAAPLTWYTTGSNFILVLPSTAIGQFGVLTGMTTVTQCDDMILISEMMQDEIVQYRG